MPALNLSGCAPIPLAHYLKALGILRLVSEQKDATATGRWHRDQFVLESSLDRDGLMGFLLEEYRPTPVLSPWNGGSGFYYQEEKLNQKDPVTGKKIKTGIRNQETAATKVVDRILNSSDARLESYRTTIWQTKRLLAQKRLIAAPETTGADKDELVLELRSIWPDLAVEWLDCVAVLTSSREAKSKTGLKPSYTTLLGSGANDGNADFTSNFMQRLMEIFDAAPEPAGKWLNASLFGENNPGSRVKALAGQYAPGTAGGANSTSGFTSHFSINPWDFILLIEGTLFFAAAALKHHESSNDGSIAYPFCVTSSGAGYASGAPSDEHADKAPTEEMWLPLWVNPCRNQELRAIFSEGRAQLRGRNARTGVDFAQAIGSLGTDAGISSFQRIGFFVRNGKSVFATPLTRITARKNAGVDLLSEADVWLDRFRRAATKDGAPSSARRALSILESRIIDLCISHTPERLLAVFIALGQCQAAAARSLKWASKPETYLPPLQGLRKAWLHPDLWKDPRTGTEFRLAAALASITGKFGKEWLPFRCHLEQVTSFVKDQETLAYRWADHLTNHVQWSAAPLPEVLNAILARRLILTEDPPHFRSELWASLSDIKAFIEGETDDALLSDLLWSMSLINWREKSGLPSHPPQRVVPPTLFAVLKLCFPPVQTERPEPILPVPAVPAIHRHAAKGNGTEAAALALRRLRASGYRPVLRHLPVQGDYACRTAAALLFPISNHTLEEIYLQTTRPEQEPTPAGT
jgi:CRISPR-associated protein Csx17